MRGLNSRSSMFVAMVLASASGQAQESAFDTPLDRDSYLPSSQIAPYSLVSTRAELPVGTLEVTVSNDREESGRAVADGRSQTTLKVTAKDQLGALLKGQSFARVALTGARPLESVVELKDGVGQLTFVTPSGVRDVEWRIESGGQRSAGRIEYAAELRPLLAVGMVETVFNIDRRQSGGLGPMSGLSDGLERELRNWERRFNNGKSSIAGQMSFFVKGSVGNDTAVTAMFDSEKDIRQREFRDYNPDRSYPVMGDSAERGFEAKTSDRFYLRLDKERDYILYGDFSTGSDFSLAQGGGRLAPQKTLDLGQYNRSMTGLRVRRDDGLGYVDAYGMREALRQSIEEYRGNGTSGPFAVGNFNALENSEKVEVIVRDRNNTSRIVSVKSLERYADYTFEPFSGRILLKSALPSVDESLNPVSLRITYEVDTGGEGFWVYGFNTERRLNSLLSVGASWMRDENPNAPVGGGYSTAPGTGFAELRELASVHVTVGNETLGTLVLEAAESDAASAAADLAGTAVRFDWQLGQNTIGQNKPRWQARVYGGSAGREWVNPASSLGPGRTEIGMQAAAQLGQGIEAQTNGSYTEDEITGGERGAISLNVDRLVNDRTRVEAGIRHYYQRNGGVYSLSMFSGAMTIPGQGPAFGGANLNPNGAGFWGMGVGLDPITGQPQSAFNGSPVFSTLRAPDLDVTTVMLGLKTRMSDTWTVGAELGRDEGFEDDPSWLAINSDYRYTGGRAFARVETPTGRSMAGADYKLSESVAMYGRWEETNGLASVYSIDDAASSRAVVLGLRRLNEDGGDLHTEVRMRDGMNAEELEAVSGLRNTMSLSDNVDAHFLVERLEILEGQSRSATAIGTGLEFGDKSWQGTTRLEWRRLDADEEAVADNTADSVMASISLARKLSGNWTGLVRNYALMTDDRSRPGSQSQNRFQLGAAFRPRSTSPFDLLLRYENKRERNSELDGRESRKVDIVSSQVNWHPNRSLWVSGRVAAKDLTETLAGVTDDYQAWLVSTRVIHDIGRRFDVSAMMGVMGTPDSDAKEKLYGLEAGYRVKDNIWVSAGYNFAGFSDRDLSGREQTEEGWYLRLRMKFDEKLLQRLE